MILQGNSIKIPLADNSVHCCISSYPYYGLRNYGLKPTVWGGDPNCRHVWGESSTIGVGRNDGGRDIGGRGGNYQGSGPHKAKATTGQFCQLCGAWLGCFGLEPTIALHVQNAVLVSREVYRVLRKDGVFFLNYGDSYSTSKNGRSAKDTKAAGNDDRTFRDKPFSVTELAAKNLIGMPWRVALALQDDGWILRSDIIWSKSNPMPESVEDRPSKSHEYIFMLVKSPRYFYDSFAVRESGKEWNGQAGTFNRTNGKNTTLTIPGQSRPSHRERDDRVAPGRNCRSVWEIPTEPFPGAHYATFPRKLVQRMILAGSSAKGVCPECGAPWKRVTEKVGEIKRRWSSNDRPTRDDNWRQDNGRDTQGVYKTTGWQPTCKCNNPETVPAVILDPFCGSGTVGAVANELGRRFIGVDLSASYLLKNALPRSERKTSQAAIDELPLFNFSTNI